MSPTPQSLTIENEPGQLLNELERRQDDVLAELDKLEAQISEVLQGLGVAVVEDDGLDLIE